MRGLAPDSYWCLLTVSVLLGACVQPFQDWWKGWPSRVQAWWSHLCPFVLCLPSKTEIDPKTLSLLRILLIKLTRKTEPWWSDSAMPLQKMWPRLWLISLVKGNMLRDWWKISIRTRSCLTMLNSKDEKREKKIHETYRILFEFFETFSSQVPFCENQTRAAASGKTTKKQNLKMFGCCRYMTMCGVCHFYGDGARANAVCNHHAPWPITATTLTKQQPVLQTALALLCTDNCWLSFCHPDKDANVFFQILWKWHVGVVSTVHLSRRPDLGCSGTSAQLPSACVLDGDLCAQSFLSTNQQVSRQQKKALSPSSKGR